MRERHLPQNDISAYLVKPNAPMSGAEVRSTKAYAPLAG